jgi:protein AbiQ
MSKQLDFFQVDAGYIKYLQKFDNRVPKVDYSAENTHDKFLCGIVLNVNGHDYFAPISSFRTPQRTNIIIKNANAIHSRARFVYNAVTVKKDPLMVKNCCDFLKLEAACAKYIPTACTLRH